MEESGREDGRERGGGWEWWRRVMEEIGRSERCEGKRGEGQEWWWRIVVKEERDGRGREVEGKRGGGGEWWRRVMGERDGRGRREVEDKEWWCRRER